MKALSIFILILGLLLPITSGAAITYFNTASTPTDNGTNTANPTAIAPPGSMTAGQLVIIVARSQASSGTLAISNTGGQTWYSATQRNNTNCRTNVYWAIYNGSWSANPSVTMAGTTNNAAAMYVFSPTSGYVFSTTLDQTESSGTFAAPASPYDVTITGVNTQTNGALVFAYWLNVDDLTWTLQTGGWTATNPAQIRNTSGTTDGSMGGAYKVQASAGATGNVLNRQGGTPPDTGTYYLLVFKETVAPSYLHYWIIPTQEGNDGIN